MKNNSYLLTSESVSEGHPDKICDQISDAVLDAVLADDPMGRVACEAAVKNDLVVVFGEITADISYDVRRRVEDIVAGLFSKIGYDDKTRLYMEISQQSPDIKEAVDTSEKDGVAALGAGDQGMMFGYAVNETLELMPLPIVLAHRLMRRLAKVRKDGTISYLRPDSKSQVTVEYDENNRPRHVNTVLVSTQHDPDIANDTIKSDVTKQVIEPILDEVGMMGDKVIILVNPSGRFVVGGPAGDAGLTGRKIIADTYGGAARHGGGAFSGKDPTKVDRSGAYAARHVAKNILAAGFADRVEVQISYAIGIAEPVSVMVDTFGTGRLSNSDIVSIVRRCFDLRPHAIIDRMKLRRPIYLQTATYGHFGRDDLDLPWEKTDFASLLRDELKKVEQTDEVRHK